MASPAFCSNCGRPLAGSDACAFCVPGAPETTGAEATGAATSGLAIAYEAPIAPGRPLSSSAPYAEPISASAYGGSADPEAFAHGGAPTGAPDLARYSGMWNWGAFFLCPLWLMNHGAVPLGILALVLSLVPLVNVVSSLGFGIYFGLKGNEWAASHRAFASDAQFVAVQNAWRNWGIGLAVLGFALSIAAFVLGALAQAVAHAMR